MKILNQNIQKIKNFKPIDYFEIEIKYNEIQDQINFFENQLLENKDKLKFSKIISTENKIQRLKFVAENLLLSIEHDNKNKVLKEDLNTRLIKILNSLKLKKTNAGWFNEDKDIKSFDEIKKEIDILDDKIYEEYIKEFGKKSIYNILKTLHFVWFGSNLTDKWKFK